MATRDPWDLPDVSGCVIGVLGGTGAQGSGLARRWALGGLPVVVGSRDAARAQQAAARISAPPGRPVAPGPVRGARNDECAAAADILVVTVPWEGHAALLGELARQLGDRLADRVVVDCVNPLGFDDRGAYPLPVPEGSAAQQAAALLGGTRVVAAFHHVPAAALADESVDRLDADVLIAGDDRAATDTVAALAGRIPGLRGVYAGRLRTAAALEALTANVIAVNRRYHVDAALRVAGL
jgi:NADPH-dependent F420 reductase